MTGFSGTVGAAFGSDFASAVAPEFERMELERMEREAATAEHRARQALAGLRQSSFGISGPVAEDDAAFEARKRRLVQQARAIRVQVNAVCQRLGRPTTEPLPAHPDDVAAAEQPPSYERAQNMVLVAARELERFRAERALDESRQTPPDAEEIATTHWLLAERFHTAVRLRDEATIRNMVAMGTIPRPVAAAQVP